MRTIIKGSFAERALIAFLLLLFSPILIVVVVVSLVLTGFYRLILTTLIWSLCCSRGRSVMLVYSRSPIWQSRIESRILPLLNDRAIVLNWSDRKHWKSTLATVAFRSFAGRRAFNPIVMIFRPFRWTKTFRLWQPYQDHKRGNSESLEQMERELTALLATLRPSGGLPPRGTSSSFE